MPEHHFNTEFAAEYGILEAVLVNNIFYWIEKNRANGKSFYNGRYWTFNSTRAYQLLFPYVSQSQIERALKHLRDEGILQTGNFNEKQYDRTLWYAFTEKGESILQKCGIHFANSGNAFCESEEPIPNNNPSNNPNKKQDVSTEPKRFVPPTVEEVSAYCLERKNSVNPYRFVDFYQSKGWKVGRDKMKDWKAAVRTWEHSDYAKPSEKLIPVEQRKTDLDHIF